MRIFTREDRLHSMIDPGVSPTNTWPVFSWIGEQVGNFQTLGIVVMAAMCIAGVIAWVAGSASDNSRRHTAGKWMVGLAIVGAVAISSAPAIIRWASGQNPIG